MVGSVVFEVHSSNLKPLKIWIDAVSPLLPVLTSMDSDSFSHLNFV